MRWKLIFVSGVPLTYLYSVFHYQLFDQSRSHTSRRNDYDLSAHSTLLFNRLRRLLRQAETFERRRLRLTTHPPMRFAETYHAHRARASHHSLVISCVARKKWLSSRGEAIQTMGAIPRFDADVSGRHACQGVTPCDCKTRRIDDHS